MQKDSVLKFEIACDKLDYRKVFLSPTKPSGSHLKIMAILGTRRADFFVENCVMVEPKAVIELEDVHLAQAMNYLEAYNTEIGLLINFGARSLQFKRVHNNKLIQKKPKPLTASVRVIGGGGWRGCSRCHRG